MTRLGAWVALLSVMPAASWAQVTPPALEAAAPEDPRLFWRSARWACLTGGAVAIGLGLVSHLQGLTAEDVVTSAERNDAGVVTELTQREALRLQESAEKSKTLGAASIGLGVALLATGFTLWAYEPPAPTRTPARPEPVIRPFSLAPVIGPDGPGVALGATF